MTDTRKTPKGRERSAPRINPTYGTRRQRQDRKRMEAEARNLAYQMGLKPVKESDNGN